MDIMTGGHGTVGLGMQYNVDEEYKQLDESCKI